METKRGETEGTSVNASPQLRDVTIKKINYYKQKSYVTDREAYRVFKDFFSEFLQSKYEFTCSELLKELNRVFLDNNTADKTVALINKFKIIEFQEDAYNQQELKQMLSKLEEIVNLLINKNLRIEKHNFFESLFGAHKHKEEVPDFSLDDTDEELDFSLESNDKKSEKTKTEKKQEEPKVKIEEKPELKITKEEQKKEEPLEKTSPVLDFEDENLEESLAELDPDSLNPDNDDVEPSTEDLDWSSTDIHAYETKKEIKKKQSKSPVDLSKDPVEDKNIHDLLEEAKKTKAKTKLKSIYKKALDKYNQLSEEDQDEFYDDLNAIYKQIKKQ